jgi:hypothetical protein
MNPGDDHRDPDVDAAWRAANRDQPPPSLDAAIAAAARRAVGTGPKSPQAPRAWWPVAAAAVVAVVAIGIVEMTPPDQIVPTEGSPAAPQATPPAELPPRQDTARDQRAPATAPPPTPSGRIEAPRKVERAAPPTRADAPAAATEASGGTTAEATRQREPAAAREAAKPGVPFPASPSDASPAMNAAAPPADKLTAAPANAKARQETTMPSSAGASAQQAPAPLAEDERKTSPGTATGALAARREPASPNAPATLAKRAKDSAAVQDEAQPHTVDEWIRLIRRLKAEGRNDLAAKELAAFRTRYQERADALLPADLREAKP